MAVYDPSIIRLMADRLNRTASWIEITSAFLGAILGAVFGFVPPVLATLAKIEIGPLLLVASIPICFFLGLLLGLSLGRSRALGLRMQAQLALCQMKIEENTRKP